MDHHLTPTPPSPMENSVVGPSSKTPTSASTPNSCLASTSSSHHSTTPTHASTPAFASTPASCTVYSDRFIPSRTGSNLALFGLAPSPSAASSHKGGPRASSESTPAALPYCTLLHAMLFGPDMPDRVVSSATTCSSSSSLGPSPVGTPATGNIFRFKTEVRRSAKRALFSGEEEDDGLFPGIFTTRGVGPRKVPRSPYKVLDVPALQDGFYLNLVDWSSHNVLAVWLGNCVYLWNACSSKVTKLCDLGVDDNVCSVGWAQRGTHLAIGTNQGKVQNINWESYARGAVYALQNNGIVVQVLQFTAREAVPPPHIAGLRLRPGPRLRTSPATAPPRAAAPRRPEPSGRLPARSPVPPWRAPPAATAPTRPPPPAPAPSAATFPACVPPRWPPPPSAATAPTGGHCRREEEEACLGHRPRPTSTACPASTAPARPPSPARPPPPPLGLHRPRRPPWRPPPPPTRPLGGHLPHRRPLPPPAATQQSAGSNPTPQGGPSPQAGWTTGPPQGGSSHFGWGGWQ
ncbi:uncharacterized protein [Miscanthus floridulus]|uniref:uncharacterized protein n=1 Tax=Miscanthus floridulus TaxID=154761 RepID=UPI00345A9566